jgi:RNAse (barnase) inhibitor barstar
MLLRSGDIRKIYESSLDIIRGYANTTYAKDKLFLYFPLPPEKTDVILERQKYFADASEMARGIATDQREKLRSLLSQVRGLYRRVKPRRIEGRVIITNDTKVFDILVKERVDRWCPVYVLSEGESGADYAQGYDLVMYISPLGVYDDSIDLLDNVEILGKDWSIEDVVPEKTVSFYARNYRAIDASCQVVELFDNIPTNDSVSSFTSALDFEQLNKVGEILKNIDENGDLAQGIDSELDRYRKAVKVFPTAVAETESWLNEEITSRISKSKVTLGGQQIISILQSADVEGADSGALRNMLPAEIVETFTTTLQEAEDKLVQMLGLTAREADWVTGIISEEISLPAKMVASQINDIEDKMRRIFAEKQFRLIKKYANELDQLKSVVTKTVQTLLEFDLRTSHKNTLVWESKVHPTSF